MADRRVAGGGLDVGQRPLVRPAHERALDAAMLIAERDLEVKDLLAVALEPEVPGLDDAGVDRTDGHLVHLVALDPEEVGHPGKDRGVVRPVPGVEARAIRVMEAHRLQPRVPVGPDAVLLRDLALEEVSLRDFGGRRIRRPFRRRPNARRARRARRVVREDGLSRTRAAVSPAAEVGRRRGAPVATPPRRATRGTSASGELGHVRRGTDAPVPRGARPSPVTRRPPASGRPRDQVPDRLRGSRGP